MIDSFVLWTPLLVLPLVALLVFVGCNWVYGLDETKPRSPGPKPTGLIAIPGNARVALSWDPYPGVTQFFVKRGETSGAYTTSFTVNLPSEETQPAYTDTQAMNETAYYYVVTANDAGNGSLESKPSDEASATPTAAALLTFITSKMPGSVVPSAMGWFGMAVRIGAESVTVQTLGRAFAPGNAQIHIIKIVNENGTDVSATSFATVNMAGGTIGEFKYAALNPNVTLLANTTYYIVSQETSGGDAFYNHTTAVTTTSAGTVLSAARADTTSYIQDSPPGKAYGPVDFQY